MRGIWTTDEIREAEGQVLVSLPPGTLMARAARAIATEAAGLLGFTYGARVLLLVGGGDNGADALWAGAELARRGVAVQAVAASDRIDSAGLAALQRAGGRLVELPAVRPPDLIIDGLVGIGATPPLRDRMLALVEYARDRRVLAVDLPSGIDPNTGAVPGPAIKAERTVTMGGYKLGLLVGAGRVQAGEISLIDLGLADHLGPGRLWQLEPADVVVPQPGPSDDKYTRGVVGVVAGSAQYPGAALLCTGAARLGGVGAVRYAGQAKDEVVRDYPEVLVTEDVAAAGPVQAWTVGPGLGSADDAVSELAAVLRAEVPVVIDADGLNLLAEHRELLEQRVEQAAPTVLTPHDREYERLFGAVGEDRVSAARRAAGESGATVLLKGYATVVAGPDGTGYVNPTGDPALATAGSGDVLAGLIGSLLAAGLEPGRAAATAAYLHGRAAGRARAGGPVVSGMLVAALRAVIAEHQR